jgi:hypothetical protein
VSISRKVSATRDEHGQWQIDPAEMHRVYPPVASTAAEQRSEQRHAPAQHRDRTDELVAALREQLADMRNERDRARIDADTWRAAFEHERAQRALPVPGNVAQAPETTPATPAEQPSRLRRAWRWMQATGDRPPFPVEHLSVNDAAPQLLADRLFGEARPRFSPTQKVEIIRIFWRYHRTRVSRVAGRAK